MVRIKICGITRPDDARRCADLGVDAIGLNFVFGPRRIDLDTAHAILDAAPPFLTPVALLPVVRGELPEDLYEFLGARWVDHVQLYGDVTPELVRELRAGGFAPILPRPVGGPDFLQPLDDLIAACGNAPPAAILFDALSRDGLGGTGRTVDWQQLADARDIVRPYAVDVSGGVESAPGLKDPAKIEAFLRAARA
jgi:phosphoribosylanthranilate isomerase